MAKKKTTKRKKKAPSPKKKKRFSRWQVFVLGIFTGLAIYWIPLDQEFSPAKFSTPEHHLYERKSVFSQSLPQTTPIIERKDYSLAYDGRSRNAHWVYHKLTPKNLEKRFSRDGCIFREDPLIPKHIRASKKDYRGSGYDRGHLCPAADSSSQEGMDETFILTNISPQVPTFNRGYWKKVESHIRNLTRQYRMVHVFSGPLYLSEKGNDGKRYVKYEVIGPQNVAVPTHFFALVFVELPTGKMMTSAYIVPNRTIDSKTPLRTFSATVEEVESASGTIFTHLIEKNG